MCNLTFNQNILKQFKYKVEDLEINQLNGEFKNKVVIWWINSELECKDMYICNNWIDVYSNIERIILDMTNYDDCNYMGDLLIKLISDECVYNYDNFYKVIDYLYKNFDRHFQIKIIK